MERSCQGRSEKAPTQNTPSVAYDTIRMAGRRPVRREERTNPGRGSPTTSSPLGVRGRA